VNQVTSISAVLVLGERPVDIETLNCLSAALAAAATDSEIIVVANEVSMEQVQRLRSLVDKVPDLTCVLLAKPVDIDVARMVGIDHAVCDFILPVTPTETEIRSIGQLTARAHEGYDIITVVDSSFPSKRKERPLYHLFYFAFYKLYGLLTHKSVKHEGVTFRLLSRTAALFIVGQYGGELLLKASYIGSAFPALQIDIPGVAQDQPQERSIGQDCRKAWRILSSTVAPLRIALFASFCAAALSVLYSGYVTLVYLFLPYVRGWTTLSLQISGMMLLFSLIFILLLEYVLQIHAGSPTLGRRGLVVREWRSRLTKRPDRLNIVNTGGSFYLGARGRSADISREFDNPEFDSGENGGAGRRDPAS
jgi:hypothetical protein